jgi:hypothetical protein
MNEAASTSKALCLFNQTETVEVHLFTSIYTKLVIIKIQYFSFDSDDGTTEKVRAAALFYSCIRGRGGLVRN